MAINYQRMQERSTRMIRQNGYAYPVTRKGSVTVVAGVEQTTPDTAFDAWGVKTDYSPGEVDGTVIQSGDIQIVFTAEQAVKIGDLVGVDGKQYRVVEPHPVKPAAVVICYRSQLRA
ncbi:hypothetical protein [Mangrovibacter phragmitis]|uniref:hypothetical protein n=1 Tax=Mangrovibacter phragmitis TaxID=1691903 RepID=UPI00336AD842